MFSCFCRDQYADADWIEKVSPQAFDQGMSLLEEAWENSESEGVLIKSGQRFEVDIGYHFLYFPFLMSRRCIFQWEFSAYIR